MDGRLKLNVPCWLEIFVYFVDCKVNELVVALGVVPQKFLCLRGIQVLRFILQSSYQLGIALSHRCSPRNWMPPGNALLGFGKGWGAHASGVQPVACISADEFGGRGRQ